MEDGIRRLSRSRRPVLVSVVIMALLLGAVLVACRSSVRRLDEAMLYEGPAFKLKVVRYHQRLPFSYDGAIAEMQCSSDKTRDVTEGTSNDPGWVSVEYVPALGQRSAQELVDQARAMYFVAGNGALALSDRILRISFDDCRSYVRWDPRDLPKAMINRAELPDFCAPKGQVDCSRDDFDFEGDRQAQYTNIQGVEKGRVSFTVRSKAFKTHPVLNISSDDGGRTWQTVASSAAGPGSGAEGAAR